MHGNVGEWVWDYLTAIVKLEPDAVMGEGLSVHYSGRSSLSDDVEQWLIDNGIK